MTSLAFGDPVVKSGIFWNVLRIWVYHTNILLLILVMKSARAEGAEAWYCSLGAETTGQICQTGTVSACFSWWGPCSPGRAAKSHFGPTSKIAQLGPNLHPFGIWLQHGDIAGPMRNPQDTPVFIDIFHVFLLSLTLRLKQCFPCCISIGPNLVWSCGQRAPSCARMGVTWTSMCITWLNMASIWGPSGSIWAQLQRQLGLQLGPRWRNLGPSWAESSLAPVPSWAKPGQLRETQCKTLKTCIFYHYFQHFLALMGVCARPCCPHRACLRPNFCGRCPHTNQVAHVNLRPIVPTLRHVGPQLGLRPTGPSSAQVGPKWPPVWPNLRARMPSLTPVAHSFPLYYVQFSGCGRFSSRSGSNMMYNLSKSIYEKRTCTQPKRLCVHVRQHLRDDIVNYFVHGCVGHVHLRSRGCGRGGLCRSRGDSCGGDGCDSGAAGAAGAGGAAAGDGCGKAGHKCSGLDHWSDGPGASCSRTDGGGTCSSAWVVAGSNSCFRKYTG